MSSKHLLIGFAIGAAATFMMTREIKTNRLLIKSRQKISKNPSSSFKDLQGIDLPKNQSFIRGTASAGGLLGTLNVTYIFL